MEHHGICVTPTRSLRLTVSDTPVRGGLFAHINMLQQAKAQRDDENEEQKAKNRKLESEVAIQLQLISSLQQHVNIWKEKFEEKPDYDFTRLKASLDAANERAAAAEACLSTATEQVGSLESANKKLTDRISEVFDTLELRTLENDTLRAEVRDLNVELRNHEANDEDTVAALQQQIDAQATALRVASSSHRALEALLNDAQDDAKQCRLRADKLESQLHASSHSVRSAELALQKERHAHETARNDVNHLRDQLRQAVTEQGALSGHLDKAHKDLRRARHKLEAEREEYRKKAAASEHDTHKLSEMRQINSNNATRMVELEQKVHALEDEGARQAQLAVRRLVQLGEAETSLDTKAKLIAEKSKEARSHAAARHAIARELEEANERAHILQEKYDDAKLTLCTLKPKFIEAKARLDTITRAHIQLGADTRDYEAKYSALLLLYNDVKQRFEATDRSNADEVIEKLQAKVHALEENLESANAFRETTNRDTVKLNGRRNAPQRV